MTNQELEVENKRLLEEVRVLRKALEQTVGFCVAFRMDKPCWEEHQDVGRLFAVAKSALERNEDNE